jgi:hypothetical protein
MRSARQQAMPARAVTRPKLAYLTGNTSSPLIAKPASRISRNAVDSLRPTTDAFPRDEQPEWTG